jgi:putative membrane protein
MNYVIRILLNSVGIVILAKILPSVGVDSWTTAIIVAFLLSIINIFVKPVLTVLTLPITILTMGLFYLILNVLIIMFVANVVDGFHVATFWSAVFFGIGNMLINGALDAVLGEGIDASGRYNRKY